MLQQLLLEAIPGWSWAPQEDAWDARRTQFAEFLRDRHRMPRVRAKDLHERALAHWYSRQRVLHRDGKLTHSRVQSLKELLSRETQVRRSQDARRGVGLALERSLECPRATPH